MDARRNHLLGVIFVTAGAVTWSSAGFFTRLIDLDYPTMIAGRGIFGAIGMLALIIAFSPRNWTSQFRGMRRSDGLFIANYIFGTICYVSSLGQTSIAHNAVIFATLPFIAALLGWTFLRELPSREAIVSSLIAMVGVVIMVGFSSDGALLGDILSFLGTASMAASIIIVRRFPTVNIAAGAVIASFTSGVIVLPFANLSAVTPPHLLYLVLFGLFNASAGLTLYSLGSRRLPPMETALISLIDTPLSPFWVWLAFGEKIGPQTLMGGLVVLFAVILHIFLSQRRQRVGVRVGDRPRTE
ncbi:MAG: DMT family transporter [Rhizobium sp.]|nr:DMT family transporter [Rhizobium sp.]